MSQTDWNRLRDVVLQRLKAKYDSLPDYQRNLPLFHIGQDPKTMTEIVLTPNQAIREVEALSENGKKVIAAVYQQMQRMQQ